MLSVVALLLVEFAATVLPPPDTRLAASATCTSSGVLPNAGGATVVNVNSTWCAASRSTWLHALGVVSVGSASSYLSLTIKNVSVQMDDNMTIGNYGQSYYPVTLTIDNATIAFTHIDAGIRVDYVVSAMPTGDVIIIKSGSLPLGRGSGTPGACPGCTLIQGNITNQWRYPIGLKVLSGTGTNKPSRVQVWGTVFKNLGNYWNYTTAALDFAISAGSSYSVLASGSFVRHINITGPFGQNAGSQFGPIGGPLAVNLGDSVPLQYAYFFGGYIGADYTRNLWDSWLYGLCQYGYPWSSQSEPALWQNTSFWYGNGTQHSGSGCKNIGFFSPYVRARNVFLGPALDANVLDGGAHNVVIDGWRAGTNPGQTGGALGPRCASNGADSGGTPGYMDYSNTIMFGGTNSGDAVLILYCNAHLNMTNDKIDTLTPSTSKGGLVVTVNPGIFPLTVMAGSTLSNLVVNNNSGLYAYPGFLLAWDSPNVLQSIQINGTNVANSRCFTLGPYANSTAATSMSCRGYGYGVRIENSTGVIFNTTTFTSMVSPKVDWFLSSANNVTLLDQAIASTPQTMLSVQATSVTWKWDNLNANHGYRLYRNGTTPATTAFTSDGSGMGTVVIANPNDGTYTYTLVDANRPVKLTVSPRAASVPASGSVQFSSIASFSDGSEMLVSSAWSATNGTVQPDGTFLPWSAGNWTVCAQFGNLSGCADVIVVPGPMVRLTPQPASVDLGVGGSVVLGAQAFDAKGNPLASVSLTWSVIPSTLGTIEQGTVFVARNVGSGNLQVSATGGGVTLISSIPVSVSSSSVGSGDLLLGNPFLMALLVAGIGGTLIVAVYAMRRKARREERSEPTTAPREEFVYQCGVCDTEVSEADMVCPKCGVSFRG